MALLAGFAGVALLLAAAGIYSVIAYSVSQRTKEIGIRMALGARRTHVIRMVIGEGMITAAAGIAAGAAAALGVTRLMRTLLFGVGTDDPLSYAGVALLLGVVALAASYIPARRATQVDPLTALRHE
jgi:putative ABC transport system permease protein